MLPRGSEFKQAVVRGRKRHQDGAIKGTRNENPLLDTRTYDVEFDDGEVNEYTANVIAENMVSQIDRDGQETRLIADIIDYKKDGHAIKKADMYVTVAGRRHAKKTTKGWWLCVQWRDGSTSWQRLAAMKESNPCMTAEYAVAQGIDDEPAFSWWVPHVLKRRNRMIAAVNKRYFKTTHKYGIRIPKSVQEAQKVDKENGNTLWMDAIEKELKSVKVAFKILDDNESIPPGYQEINCHFVFDVKMEDFRRKARLVAGGHMTEPPKTITYASVVSRETVRIALMMAALNALEVKASDIQNAYLTAPNAEKIWTTLGVEWGPYCGKKALITRALYGLKSAGASFRNHLADCMSHLGYKPCMADPDLWYKPEIGPDDQFKYYAYMLLYVDDCLCIHHDAERELGKLDKYFMMKPGSIGDPNFNLGAKLKRITLDNGVVAWGMSSSKYVQEAVSNVEKRLKEKNLNLPKRATTLFAYGLCTRS